MCQKRDPLKFDPLVQELKILHLTVYLFIILLLLYNLQIYSFFYSYDELECNSSLIKIGCRKSCLIIIRIDTYRWWEFWFCIFFLFRFVCQSSNIFACNCGILWNLMKGRLSVMKANIMWPLVINSFQ